MPYIMGEKTVQIYIKGEENVLINTQSVLVRDILKVYGTDKRMVNEINHLNVFTIKEKKKNKYVVSVLKVIEVISERYPEADISNLGEPDIVVEYEPPKKSSIIFEVIKTAIVCLIVFSGSFFTIMTFNEDVAVTKIFEIIDEVVLGKGNSSNGLLQISYSIGLPVGIIAFFGHFSKLRADNDPTPLQVQIKLYQDSENKAITGISNKKGNSIDIETDAGGNR